MLTNENIKQLLDDYPIQSEYSHFSSEVMPPYITWLRESTNNFNADDLVYSTHDVYRIELYTRKDVVSEELKLEQYLNDNNLLWRKIDQTWIDDEKLYMSIYEVS